MCPICKIPVTFGGGITIVNGGFLFGVEAKKLLSIQNLYHLDSKVFESKFFEISI